MSPKVLVVDDEPDVRVLCKVNLEFEGYKVIAVGDGAAALETIKADPPDLVLLDLMMPGMDGWEVLRNIKESDETAAIPVVVLTAKADADSELRGWEEGVLDYITKPFNPLALAKYVESALETKDPAEEEKRREQIISKLRSMRELPRDNA